MTDTSQSIRDDIAFLRDLARDDGAGLARDGAAMVCVGGVFGVVTFVYWLMFSGYWPVLPQLGPWLWVAGVGAMIVISMVLKGRLPPAAGATSRAIAAAWSGVGVSLIAPCVGLIFGGARIGAPQLVLWIFPVIMFTLYGVGWAVAMTVKRRAWFALVSAGCFATALVEGALVSSAYQWLVLSAGLVLWVAMPGVAILRQARAAA